MGKLYRRSWGPENDVLSWSITIWDIFGIPFSCRNIPDHPCGCDDSNLTWKTSNLMKAGGCNPCDSVANRDPFFGVSILSRKLMEINHIQNDSNLYPWDCWIYFLFCLGFTSIFLWFSPCSSIFCAESQSLRGPSTCWGEDTTALAGKMSYTLVNSQFAIENGHRNSWFSHSQWWFSIVFWMFTRGYIYKDFPLLCLIHGGYDNMYVYHIVGLCLYTSSVFYFVSMQPILV